MENAIETMERINRTLANVNTGYYSLYAHEVSALYDTCKKDLFIAISTAFEYGFVKGQRAERARVKKLKKNKE